MFVLKTAACNALLATWLFLFLFDYKIVVGGNLEASLALELGSSGPIPALVGLA